MVSGRFEIRKTKSVVVKALCDMVRPIIEDLVVLELFAGTGRVSRGLLDEGAAKAYAVDRAPRKSTSESDALHWYEQDVFDFLVEGPPESIDLVFMDPPYESDYPDEILPRLPECWWLKEKGIVVLETDADHPSFFSTVGDNGERKLYLLRERNYGGTRLVIYQADRREPAIEKSN